MTFEELQQQGYDITKREYMAGREAVVRSLRESLDDIRSRIRKLYDKLENVSPENYFNEAVKYRRLASLEKQVTKAYQKAARSVGRTVEGHAKVGIANNYYRQQFALKLGSSLTDANMSFAVLPDEVIQASVYGTESIWRNRFGTPADYQPRSGALLRAVLADNRDADLRKLRQAITQSLTRGEPYREAARRVKDVLDTSASNAMRIIRTEGHRNAVAGQLAAKRHAQEEGVEARRRIVSVMDSRTRPQSARVDGRRENEDGMFEYPGGLLVRAPGNSGVAGYDINDRETVVMDIPGVEPNVRRARDPVTGETDIISYRNFDTWAREQGLTRNRYGQIMEA